MTTIAYKNGVMAADTLAVKGNHKHAGAVKLFTVEKCLVGFAGDMCDIPVLLDWLEGQALEYPNLDWRTPKDFPEDMDTSVLIVSFNKGIQVLEHGGCLVPIAGDMHAIGTGSQFAIGAMAHGASAAKAVSVTSTLDAYTGGGVMSRYVPRDSPFLEAPAA